MSALHRAQDAIEHLVCQGSSAQEIFDFIDSVATDQAYRKRLLDFYNDLLCTILDANYSHGEGQ